MRTILALLLIFAAFNGHCQAVNKITYSDSSMGGVAKVIITKDSIKGELTNTRKKIIIKEKTQKKYWDRLVRAFSIAEFEKVGQKKHEPQTDGNVTYVSVETKEQTYSVRDAYIDPVANKSVYDFKMIIREKFTEVYEKNKGK